MKTIEFFKNGDSNKKLPWLLDEDKSGLSQILIIKKDYIKNTALSNVSHNALFDEYSTRFYQWDILTLYPDYPFPSLFHLDRIHKTFPEPIRSEYNSFSKEGQLSENFKGKQNPELLEIINAVTELQTEWMGDLFISPLYYSRTVTKSDFPDENLFSRLFNEKVIENDKDNPARFYFSQNIQNEEHLKECLNQLRYKEIELILAIWRRSINYSARQSKDFFYSLYGFSGQLIGGLLVLSEMIYSIESGISFQHEYATKLNEYAIAFFDNIPQSNVAVADLLFLHNAILRFWLLINGRIDNIELKYEDSEVIFSPRISAYKKNAPVINQFRTFLTKNPVSPILLLDILSDTRILNPYEDKHFPTIRCLFKNDIHDDVIFWLANHLYSGLMASYMKSGNTCFETYIPDSSEKLFAYRVNCVGQILSSALEEIGKNIDSKNRVLTFCAYFYNILLMEWLQEFNIENFSSHPLPKPDIQQIPLQVSLSHILISESKGQSYLKKIIDKLKKGENFAALARKYSEDSLNGRAGGSLGSIKIDNLPFEQEPAVFLAKEDSSLFLLTAKEAYHIFLVHGREFSKKMSLFERVIQFTQRDENHELKSGCLTLLKPLDILIESVNCQNFSHKIDKGKIERIKKLYQKTQFYQRMLAFSQESITPL